MKNTAKRYIDAQRYRKALEDILVLLRQRYVMMGPSRQAMVAIEQIAKMALGDEK